MHVDYVKVFMSSPVNNDEHSNLAKGDETFLRKYKYEIIVTKTDKGNKTVIMYRDTYKHGMETLLAEKKHTEYWEWTPHKSYNEEINGFAQTKLHNHGFAQTKLHNCWEKFKLTTHASNAPRLYGLPKVHKPNMHLRPISS